MDKETAHIKRLIRKRLDSYTYYSHECSVCRKYLCHLSTQRELICFDCWNKYRVKPKQTGKQLLKQLLGEIQKSRN